MSLVAPAGAAAAGPANGQANRETVTGVLEAYYIDDFDGSDGHDGPRYDLRTAAGTIPVRFAGGGPRRLVGSKVTLTGTRSGGALHVATTSPATSCASERRPVTSTPPPMPTRSPSSS